MASGPFRTKRVYLPAAADDGTRGLVDRLWARGLGKAGAAIDLWLKEVAPSAALRKWFGHDPARFAEFAGRYRRELDANAAAIAQLRALAGKGTVTLLYGAHDEVHNQAEVLADYLGAGGGAHGHHDR
jgi:uncharacterized protein YeaO (DUF488 family)